MENKDTVSHQAENSQPTDNSTNYKRSFFIVLVVLAVAVGATYVFVGNPMNYLSGNDQITLSEDIGPNDPIAMVNGEQITRSQFEMAQSQLTAQQGVNPQTLDEQTQTQVQSQALNSLISQILITQEVENSGITLSDEEIDAQIETVKAQYESEEAYQEDLAAQGATEEDVRSQIETQLKTQAYLNQELGEDALSATDEEIEAAYEQVTASAQEGDEVPPLEEVRPQIEQSVIQQKQQQQMPQLLQRLQAEADIEILI